MANSWQANEEDEEWRLKEPTFQPEQDSSYRPAPDLPPAWKHQAGLVLMTVGIFVATIALGEITSRVLAKWLD